MELEYPTGLATSIFHYATPRTRTASFSCTDILHSLNSVRRTECTADLGRRCRRRAHAVAEQDDGFASTSARGHSPNESSRSWLYFCGVSIRESDLAWWHPMISQSLGHDAFALTSVSMGSSSLSKCLWVPIDFCLVRRRYMLT